MCIQHYYSKESVMCSLKYYYRIIVYVLNE